MTRRVVVTGLGLVTPVGLGRKDFWEAVTSGRSGIRPVQAFDTGEYAVHVGAEVPGFQATRYLRRQKPGQMGRASQMAVAAAGEAIADSGFEPEEADPWRVGVCIGTTSGEPVIVERFNDARNNGGLGAFDSAQYAHYPCASLSARVSDEFLFQGPCLTIPTACAAGNFAIGHGFELLRAGRIEAALAGGSDAFSRIPYAGFARLGAIAPERCRPFDRDREGMVPGEGAAVLLLEPEERARSRGAEIYAEVLGYGVSCDAHHMTAGHPQGDGAVRATEAALEESGVSPDEVDYVSAHGTGTPTNDRIESCALQRVFGGRAGQIPMSSIKSMLGHTMGAASAIEAAACALAIQTGIVPPTINFQTPDPDCPVDCVPNEARKVNPRTVLNNAYAFGGTNASLCLRKYEP